MSGRIVLVRHGRSAHVPAGLLDRDALHGWHAAYDAAGIAGDDAPPAALRELARSAAVIVSSDLPRAVASAALLAPDRVAAASALLRETAMVVPPWRGPRLPLMGWALVIGAGAGIRALRGECAPAEVGARADAAAEWLAHLAGREGTVVAVTHATFRRHLARALGGRGWRGTGPRRLHHWSAWAFSRGG